jgi:hypothetical protein
VVKLKWYGRVGHVHGMGKKFVQNFDGEPLVEMSHWILRRYDPAEMGIGEK